MYSEYPIGNPRSAQALMDKRHYDGTNAKRERKEKGIEECRRLGVDVAPEDHTPCNELLQDNISERGKVEGTGGYGLQVGSNKEADIMVVAEAVGNQHRRPQPERMASRGTARTWRCTCRKIGISTSGAWQEEFRH